VLLLGGSLFEASVALAASDDPRLLVTASDLAQARRNVFDLKLGFARRAWTNTLARANAYLGHQPSPTRPDSDLSDWRQALYLPGLYDGNAALTLATAYALGGRRDHGERAKAICLAWARTYRPVPSLDRIGHMVAEPVGAVIKLCLAFDLARPVFSAGERAEFISWAAQFVARGRRNADFARDRPWVPDVLYGEDRSNPAPYGNSATWQRAMAVCAAGVVGGATLRQTLLWNFQHATSGGLEYGWDNLLEGLVIDDSGGQVTEDRHRSSIHYGHFAWIPTVLIAQVARNARFQVDLFEYKTALNAYSVFTPLAHYAGFATRDAIPDSREKTTNGGTAWPTTAARLRATYEVLYRNATDPATVQILRRTVNYGGPRQRGDNFDVYVLGYAALFGRGPKGPKPAPRAR
jgi:hypothetical protein